MASATPSESVDSELRCSICLGTFVCPCALSCGHSFCLQCLEDAWGTASSVRCPQCRETFPVRPQLRRNVALANLAEQIRVGDRSSDHVLVAPTVNLKEQICKEHREELKYFCEQDKIPVCTRCTITGDHSEHRVITVENAQQTRQEELRLKKEGREEKRNTAESRTRTLRDDYQRVEESLRGIKARISREFERRREQLWDEEREALERVNEEGCSVLSRIQADIDHYKRRARDLEQEINELQAALAVQDPLSFLQDPLHESLRSLDSQVIQDAPPATFSHKELTEVISLGGVNTKRMALVYGCSPTLDTNSAGDHLQISVDHRTVTRSSDTQCRPHHPHRFECSDQVLCSESFSSGQHYWEVDVGSARGCWVGVAHGRIPRSGDKCVLGGSDDSWCLLKRRDNFSVPHGYSFSVRHGGVGTSLSVSQPPRRVGVHVDCDTGRLTFYSVDSMTPLHSFRQTFTEPLYPSLKVFFIGDSVRIVDLSGAS